MNICKHNENVIMKIHNALENTEPNITPATEKYFKSIYGPATLMNDWYQKRLENLSQPSTEPPISEHMDEYRPQCKTSTPDRADYFAQIFDSYGLGQELLIDHLGFSFYDNYTTSYDLMFNHLKKGICGPFPRHYVKGRYLPETDLTDMFGNLTQWGLKERVYKQMQSKNCEENPFKSETLAEYVAHDLYTVKKLNDFKNFKRVKAIY